MGFVTSGALIPRAVPPSVSPTMESQMPPPFTPLTCVFGAFQALITGVEIFHFIPTLVPIFGPIYSIYARHADPNRIVAKL